MQTSLRPFSRCQMDVTSFPWVHCWGMSLPSSSAPCFRLLSCSHKDQPLKLTLFPQPQSCAILVLFILKGCWRCSPYTLCPRVCSQYNIYRSQKNIFLQSFPFQWLKLSLLKYLLGLEPFHWLKISLIENGKRFLLKYGQKALPCSERLRNLEKHSSQEFCKGNYLTVQF